MQTIYEEETMTDETHFETLELIEPREDFQAEYLEFVEEFRQAGEGDELPGGGGTLQGDFSDFVRRLLDHGRGIGLPEGRVPASTFWLVRGRRILGVCNLRHTLNDFLRDYGGHIGYSIRPSERRKGYATQMLRMVLERARERGIDRARITCDAKNIASAKVILKCGGVLESESYSPHAGRVTQRYWIDLGSREQAK
jgi:predicted acetyltransferase